ncbi:hypothetical protein [Azospirillum sp. sgz301742]
MLELPRDRVFGVLADAFDLVGVAPDVPCVAGVDAVLLRWHERADSLVRRVRGHGYRGPLIAALDSRSPDHVVAALSSGCDDAQPYPCDPRELRARIGAIHQRAAIATAGPARIRSGCLEIGRDGSDPWVDGKPLKVSPNCAKVLAAVALAKRPVPLPRLAAMLYGAEPPPSKTINTYLCMLRTIMTAATGRDGWLKLKDGGYVLSDDTACIPDRQLSK